MTMPDDELAQLLAPSEGERVASGLFAAKERVGIALDVAWMLAMAIGVTWGLWTYAGPWALTAGGLVLAALTNLAAYLRARADSEPAPLPVDVDPEPAPLPGPEDAGPLHVSGR